MAYSNDYSTTSYGAAGASDSGGFMPGSQESPNAKRRYGKDTLRPVTIKQIELAELPHPDADAYLLDGNECTQITFVGQIMNVSHQATNVTYMLDDGTGRIEVKVWVDPERGDEGEEGAKAKGLVENAYVRAWGKIKVYGKKHVVAHSIRPLADLNEVGYHLLEATVVHLQLTRGPPGGEGAQKGGANGVGSNGGGSGMGGGNRLGGASSAARKVFQCLEKTEQGSEGLHMQDIAMRIGLDTADVLKAGDELQSMGLIYTTVDDSTWAILDLS